MKSRGLPAVMATADVLVYTTVCGVAQLLVVGLTEAIGVPGSRLFVSTSKPSVLTLGVPPSHFPGVMHFGWNKYHAVALKAGSLFHVLTDTPNVVWSFP